MNSKELRVNPDGKGDTHAEAGTTPLPRRSGFIKNAHRNYVYTSRDVSTLPRTGQQHQEE